MNTINNISCDCLFDLEHTVAAELFEDVTFPFEVLPKIGEFLKKLLSALESKDYNVIGEDIYIAKTAKLQITFPLRDLHLYVTALSFVPVHL